MIDVPLHQEHDLDFQDQSVMVLGCGPYHIGEFSFKSRFNILSALFDTI